MGLIYKLTSKTSGKSYIGQTRRVINTRLTEHKSNAFKGIRTHFYSAIRKYGFEDFNVDILVDNLPTHLLNESEDYWMKYYDTLNNGYNMQTALYNRTDEDLNTMSERMKINNPMYNKDIVAKIKENHYMKNKCNVWNKGSKHPNSIIITIYDNNDNIYLRCDGGFDKFCEVNNLPFYAFVESYQNEGKKLYQSSKNNYKQLINNGNIRFKGFRAIKS